MVLIGWLYLVPQLQGASLTLSAQIGAPRWAGGLLVCAVVLIAVAVGGMRSITFAQAVQYWIKLTALLVPAAVLGTVWRARGDRPARTRPATAGCTRWARAGPPALRDAAR